MKNFRAVKNLGSRINSVVPSMKKDDSGFTVSYIDGDVCLADTTQNYRSNVRYLCDHLSEDQIVDFPLLDVPRDPTTGPYKGNSQCVFEFVWESRFACSPCSDEQVIYT